jgi:hypothetical protein
LRWDDWTNVDQDYDLYLYQWDDINGWWELVAYSEEYQDGTPGKTPTEQITYVTADEYGVDDGYGFYGFLISRWDSDRAVNLEVFAPKVDRLDEIVTARSLANLADSPNAMTVAALDVTSPYPQEPYSSEGPTNGPGGTAGGGATKPDISGFANVSTESYAPAVFNGTSAATPHAAGAAALVIDAHPSWTPDEVEAFLTGRAVDMGSSGMDNLFGHGRLTLGDPPAAPMTLGPPADFDGDGDTDVSVFRPANGRWYIYGEPAFNWGLTGDIPAPADYDGDGDAEATVFRPGNGRWYVLGDPSRMYGMGGDVPVPCDYDGDGEAEIAVFRPANGRWYVLGEAATTWGKDGDMPLPGDYDGDGACERAVFRPSNGRWYIEGEAAFTWGLAGDLPVPGDYDGDGSWEAVVFRPGNGRWYIQGQSSFMWGVGGDIPVSGDFDADGSWEVAVFRPSNGRWYVREGFTRSYGMDGDFPLPSMDTNGDGDVYH